MRILVTGARGFIGKNLIAELKNRGYEEIYEYNRDTDKKLLNEYVKQTEFVYHLAGVNRPQKTEEFMVGNFGLTSELLNLLKEHNNKAPVLFASSIQAERNNDYGKSKKAAEDLLFVYSKEMGIEVCVYRLPNVFGKWCKPNYNSVVATFCHNVARGLEIEIDEPEKELILCYIDDVIEEFISAMEGNPLHKGQFCVIPVKHSIKLGEMVKLIYEFRESRKDLSIPDMGDAFTRKLYSTYLSYLPEDEFSYELVMHKDSRGSFTEFLRTLERGQVSVNVSRPQTVKGNHWHHSKNEKFLVVSGRGIIRFRNVNSDQITEYYVDGNKLEVVDIPPGYAHNIENVGDSDMVTIMWANEPFDPQRPDTYHLEV